MFKKLIASFALFAFLTAPLVSVAEETYRVYSIYSFDKGLNSQISPYILGENQATIANNVRFNNGAGGVAKRPIMIAYGEAGSHTVRGLHRFYKANGTKKLILAGSTKLYVGDDDAGTFQTIKTGLTDGKRWQFVTYQDKAIGMNGFDRAIKYDGSILVTDNTDGHRTANELCAQLGAPFAELNTGANLDASSWYMYKIAFYNGTTYSYSNAKSNPIKTGATVRDITLTDIPLGPAGTTQRIIYRTVGDASQAAVEADASYYQVATIADNTTTTYNDAVDDTTLLADAAPTRATVEAGTNVTPPLGAIATIHDERLFIGGNKTTQSDISWSDILNPDHYRPVDFLEIRADDGDAVTFLKEHLGIMTIGKTNTIQKIYTEGPPEAWIVSAPFSFIGNISIYSAVNTPRGIVYLGLGGLYVFNGQSSSLLSDAVTPAIKDILVTNFAEVAGFYFKNEYHMAYASTNAGGTTNDRVLVYDFVRDAFSIDTKEINTFTAFDSGSDFGVLYLGSSDTDGKVWADEGSPPLLIKRTKTEFNSGTFDDARVYGDDENSPTMELSWDTTIDAAVGTINAQVGDINRPDTDGTWTSPVYQINASALDLIYWNESLGSTGDVTFQIRSGATATVDGSWSAYSSTLTNPNGGDISGITANDYIQIKINLSTTDIDFTPTLFVTDGFLFKLTYIKAGATPETDVLSVWQSGWKDFGVQGYKKFIHRIKVFYTGTTGTITFNYQNDENDVDNSFTIDLSKSAGQSDVDGNKYTGDSTNKIFTFFPPANSLTIQSPIGQYFMFNISETGEDDWTINRIECIYTAEEIYD